MLLYSALPLQPVSANDFTPGGTLVDYTLGVNQNNPDVSHSRMVDNSNVLFYRDYYFKFGTAAPWIEPPGSMEFPKSMPYTKIQQRYDALHKYRYRVVRGIQSIQSLANYNPTTTTTATTSISANDFQITTDRIPDPKLLEDVYALRPMGLLANNLLASENTGMTNELLLAHYYINEIFLLLGDLQQQQKDNAMTTTIITNNDSNQRSMDNSSPQQQKQIYIALTKAVNSYLTLMNRVITEKVGEKFAYI